MSYLFSCKIGLFILIFRSVTVSVEKIQNSSHENALTYSGSTSDNAFKTSLRTTSYGSSNGSIRYPFEYRVASQASENYKSNSCFPRECSLHSMWSDYYVPRPEFKQSIQKIESLVSIGIVNLAMDERTRKSSSERQSQAPHSENKLQSPTYTSAFQDTANRSINDVKVKGRNIFREKLIQWNIIQDNQVGALPEYVWPREAKVIDGETLIQVGSSKDTMYYYAENGLIGKGGYGSVYKGYAMKGEKKTPVAVKFVKYISVEEYCKDKDLGLVPSEVYYLKKMKEHPNVITFLHYQRISPDVFVIICERPTHCQDLFDLRQDKGGFFTEDETKKYITKLLDVELAMQTKNIVHRDIKLENILYDFDTDEIKLIDFGLASKHKSGKVLDEYCGSEMNVPPEYVINRQYDPSKEAVRSIGVVIYQMLYGRAPYTNYNTFSDVIAGLPKFDHISEEVKDLLTKLFAMNPKNRPSLKEVAKHSWLRLSRSFTERVSGFFRGIFRKRRGSYVVCGSKMAKQSATGRVTRHQAVSQRINNVQSSNHTPLKAEPTLAQDIRAIEVGLSNNHHSANQDHPAACYNPFAEQ
ncbi:probable myosin light chain kinase DDB_G0284661 [Dendronephthya gigantea]|uniref:probable myosin light chain kinase DDB_G0284661 n=1 Tax=Dendronephthya gigantea TaxID=151771 RepID=UPI00106B9DBD|nr:probable myosin light chain kinase DDB_G0284661 [Dendronephthya gigantea]